jgi:hypothetical protein
LRLWILFLAVSSCRVVLPDNESTNSLGVRICVSFYRGRVQRERAVPSPRNTSLRRTLPLSCRKRCQWCRASFIYTPRPGRYRTIVSVKPDGTHSRSQEYTAERSKTRAPLPDEKPFCLCSGPLVVVYSINDAAFPLLNTNCCLRYDFGLNDSSVSFSTI